MKRFLIVSLVLLFTGFLANAQSNSFQALKDKFKGQEDVFCFSVSGWVGRTVLKLAGENEFRNAVKDLKHVRLITIPRSEFAENQVTVNGFKKVLKQDEYEEIAFIHDDGEDVTIYVNEGKNNNNHYFILVEEADEIVGIEMKGYIDVNEFNPKNTKLSYNR